MRSIMTSVGACRRVGESGREDADEDDVEGDASLKRLNL